MYYQAALHHSVRIADNLYFYIWRGQGNNCNTCLLPHTLRGERPHVIVDPGLVVDELREPCLESLTRSMEKDGFRAEDIGLIINTHAHPDHCGANQTLVQKTQRAGKEGIGRALIALGQEEVEYRREMGKRFGGLSGGIMRGMQFEPSFFLMEGELILGSPNGMKLHVLHTPGHSPGSLSFYCPECKALISGDVVFYGSVGRTDFPGCSATVLKQSIEKLSMLDVEYLLPGHSTQFGSMVEGKELVRRNFMAVRSFFS